MEFVPPAASGDADDADEADIGEDVAVEFEAPPAADAGADEAADAAADDDMYELREGPVQLEVGEYEAQEDEAAAPPPVDGVHPMDTCEDSQLPPMDEAAGLEASVGGELGLQAPDDGAKPTATIDADGVKDAVPEPMAAAGDEPDGSLDEQEPENPDAAPLLAEEAVQLPEQIRAQLSDLGIDADLQLFLQQKALKAQARQQKAEKTLQSAAKAQARAEAKAAKEQAKQQDEEPKALPKRKAKAKSANKRKAEEPAASAGDSEAAAAEPKKAKLAATRLNTLTPHLVPSRYSWASIAEGTIESIMAELEPVFKLGLVRPTSSQLKQKSYIMAPPETASDGSKIQVIAHKNHFYVLKTSVSPLAVRVCEHFDLQVNEKKGTNVNWNRHGFVFGFKIAKIIAGAPTTRRWIMKLKNRMTRESRSKYQAAAKKVVVRKKRSDGTTAVWGAYTHIEYLSGLGQSVYQLRTGTKHLTATQAYPEGFAKADSPGNWTEAELDELQEFLVSEASKGVAATRTMPALTNLMLMVLAALTQLMFMMLLVVVKFVGGGAEHPIPVSARVQEMVEKAQARRGRTASASPTPVPKEPSARQVATPSRSKSRGPPETMPPPASKMSVECDTPRKQPVRTVSQTSVETPSKQPVRTVSQTSVETPSKQPVRTVSQTSVETPSKQPVRTVSQTSVETPSKQPVRTLSQTTVETPSKQPVGTLPQTTVETPSKQPVETPCKPKPMALDTPAKLKPVETPSKMSVVDETPQKHQMHATPQVPMSVGSTMSTPLKSPDYKRLRLGPSEETLPSMPSFEVQTPSSYRHADTQSTIAEQLGELHLGESLEMPPSPVQEASVQASAKVNLTSPGQKEHRAEVTTHVELTNSNGGLSASTDTSVEVSVPAAAAKPDPDELEQELGRLVDAATAAGEQVVLLPKPTPDPQPSVAAANKTQKEEKLEHVSSMIQAMLKRPGTIDIEALQKAMGEASTAQDEKSETTAKPPGPVPTAQTEKSETTAKPPGPDPTAQTEKSETTAKPRGPDPTAQTEKSEETAKPRGPDPGAQAEKSEETAAVPDPDTKPKKKKRDMTDDEREAHNYYMKFYSSSSCPPEVAEKAFDATGRRDSDYATPLRAVRECRGELAEFCHYAQREIKKKGTRHGKYIWRKYEDVKAQFGEAVGKNIFEEKKTADPNMTGKWVMKHPDQKDNEDWILLKCFDSKTETNDSESETEFGYEQEVGLEGSAAASALSL
ncbi:hypothetical protein AK812_SmicGene10848 [Symbiodinium microadriaticum]|uniref:Uncharacterized protein n=1 Tax=Symbiodinium microadriaticum TaxID=2951 RepID=A0A1Q9EEP6_SYMMI|nr:hypothetical protein AK812_SmicGene10848 [Symbiodinium microadriaticum]